MAESGARHVTPRSEGLSMGLWVGICVALALAVLVGVTFNELVAARNRVRAAWSGIDVELQRRHDLIPALTAVVQGYAAHERDVFGTVADLRAKAQADASVASRGRAEAELGSALGRLIAVQERYPELKANENFLGLQQQLATTEDRLQAARSGYNAAVQQYNTQLDTFPDVLIARPFGFAPREFFQAEAGAAAVPGVGA
jgi:LemA protein